jgi:hypothetical protein
MDDLENRRREMFIRAHGFGVSRAADFPSGTLGAQLSLDLAGVIAELNQHAATQVSGFGGAQQGTSTRAAARQALRDRLRAINRTAEAIAQDIPGFDDPFRMPPFGNDQNLLHAARAMAANALPVSAQFISHELPADFLADLNSTITNFETTIAEQANSVGAHVSASAAIDEAIAEGLKIVKKLDAIVRNKYADDPAALAAWTSASHTERSPKKAKSPASSPEPSNPPPS